MCRRLAALALTLTCVILTPTSARATEVAITHEARAANATWLTGTPAPPSGARTLCLVDSGVDVNAETTNSVFARTSLDGAGGDDVDSHHHGTSMAMLAGAPANGVGMVGIWPAIRIVSVRAAAPPAPGEHATFAFGDYARAITVCLAYPDIAVISLALGSTAPSTSSEIQTFVDKIVKAHALGVSVLAAAGNDPGPVQIPASFPGVLAVGAGDADGALCALSARGDGLDLIAPGCGLDVADPVTLAPLVDAAGTSQATTIAATALDALRSYRPDLDWQDAEALLRARPDGVLDVAATFRAAGLGAFVHDEPPPTTPETPPTSSPAAPAEVAEPASPPARQRSRSPKVLLAPAAVRRFARPVVRVGCHEGIVRARIAHRPQEAIVDLLVQRHGRPGWFTIAHLRRAQARLRVPGQRCTGRLRVRVRFSDRYGDRELNSDPTVARVLLT